MKAAIKIIIENLGTFLFALPWDTGLNHHGILVVLAESSLQVITKSWSLQFGLLQQHTLYPLVQVPHSDFLVFGKQLWTISLAPVRVTMQILSNCPWYFGSIRIGGKSISILFPRLNWFNVDPKWLYLLSGVGCN